MYILCNPFNTKHSTDTAILKIFLVGKTKCILLQFRIIAIKHILT